MKKILAVAMVLGIAAVVANAGIAVTWSKTGTYTITTSTAVFTVETYKVTASTDDSTKITAVSVYGRGPLVQNWKVELGEQLIDPETEEPYDPPQYGPDVYTPTPTMNNTILTSNARNADTHFLFSDNQLIAVTAPTETNDLTKGRVGTTFPKRAWGLGENTLTSTDPKYDDTSYQSDAALAIAIQATSVTFFQFSIIAGTYANSNWEIFGGATNGVVEESFRIPEPATLSLIGLGGLALIRRKR